MGNTRAWNGFSAGLQATGLVVEESQIVVHESDEPDALVDLLDAHVLAGEHGAEIDLAPAKANAPAVGDRHRTVV